MLLCREIDTSIKANHPNLVKTYEYAATGSNYYIMYEYCDKGSLDQYIKANKAPLTEYEAI